MSILQRLCRPVVRILLVSLACVLFRAAPAAAQVVGADLVGRVVDPSGAAAPGATVTVTSIDLGSVRTTTSGTEGLYRVSSLPPGRYMVTAALDGFEPASAGDVQLNIGGETTQNLTLGAAGVAEQITVSAAPPLVEPTNSSVHEVVSQAQIATLPLNSRNFAELALLVSGVDVDDTEEEEQDAKGQIQIAAQPSRNTRFIVDGADTTTEGFGGNQVFFSQDAIQEFRVLPALFAAEFGHTNAGVVQVVTKSGTNEVHGTAFSFFRDRSLNARGFFEQEKPDFSRQQFGGTVGGPLARNRTHVFGSYERQRQREFTTVNTFGAFPGEEGTFPQPIDNDLGFVRLTHQFTGNRRLSGKYALDHRKDRNVAVGGVSAASHGGNDDEYRQHVVVTDSWVIGPRLLNELTGAVVNRHSESFRTTTGPELFYPSIVLGGNNDYGVDFRERKGHIRDDLTFSLNDRHTLKFGYEYIDAADTGPYPLFLPGAFFFSSDTATVPDFGLVATDVFDEGNRVAQHGVYAQDSWRLSPTLTVDVGVRYDFQLNALNEHEQLPESDRLGRPRPPTDRNNVAPRGSLAFDLFGNGRTVLRGGAGLYYDRIFQNIPFLEILSNSSTSVVFVIAPTDLNDPIGSSVFSESTGPTTTLDVLSPDFQTPFAFVQDIGWSQQVSPSVAFDLDYVHSGGHHEFGNRPINIAPGGPKPFPSFGRIREFTSDGRSTYHALQVKVTGRAGARSGMLVSYTLADATNDADDFRRQPPSDPFDLSAERGPSGTVSRHRFVGSGFVTLPADFIASAILTARSGQPYNIIVGSDVNGDGFNQDRPAGVGRNSGDGPTYVSLDLRAVKRFAFAGARNVQLIWEAFNVTNRVNYDKPIRVQNSPSFGQFAEALAPRQMQLAARFSF